MNLTSRFSASLNGPDWLKNIRAQAAENIERLSLPTASEELWRYSRVSEIDLENLQCAPTVRDVPSEALALRNDLGDVSAFVVTCNGALVSRESVDSVHVRIANEFAEPQDIAVDVDAFTRLNAAFTPSPVFIDVNAGALLRDPIVIVHWTDGEDAAVFSRVVVRAGQNCQATVLEYFISSDKNALVSSVSQIEVAQAAHLTYVDVQLLSDHVRHIALQSSSVDQEATFKSTALSLGGDYARTRTDSRLIGTGASSKLRAVYVGRNSQMHDFRTLQDHRAPKTTSDLLFKGVVGDTARSVYSGLIRVEKGASGTNAFQTNRNLVLSEGAHADSVPNLEIEENDVRCSHASAVGPVDEEQLYYLESRGVPTDIAERLIVNGFLHEVVDEIGPEKLRTVLADLVSTRLNQLTEVSVSQ
jgi:Fe-S cluster assembly protein SufD